MKKTFSLLLAGMLAVAAHAQQMDQAAMMKAWQAFMTPGDIHKMLAKSDGKWTTETTLWEDPSKPPTKSAGTCMNMMVLGGRYQESVFKGTMMNQPFEGRGLLAYDNGKKVFVNTWVDNMGTGITKLEGKWDDATKSITFTGKTTDPLTGQDSPMKEVFTIKDDNHHMLEMYMTFPDGKEFKTMEIIFTRAGKKS